MSVFAEAPCAGARIETCDTVKMEQFWFNLYVHTSEDEKHKGFPKVKCGMLSVLVQSDLGPASAKKRVSGSGIF